MGATGILERDALHFVEEMVSLYFDKRDMSALLRYMEGDTSWIGTGEGELCHSLAEAASALEGDLSECGAGFQVRHTAFQFAPLGDDAAVVYGTLTAVPLDTALSEEAMRLSVALRWTDGGLKLAHMHFSHADPIQEQGEHFVKRTARADSQSLRQELSLRECQLANLTKNVPGGAHQCANDAALTLLSVSDGFLAMFGYTREEIDSEFGGKFINMVYPGDRAELLKSCHRQMEKGTDLELEYRMLRRTGQPIWVLDKGRLIDDGSGHTCFYCLLIDITRRKRQEEELRLSLERHQVIMDQATDIIFEWDILEDKLKFSANWKKKFGYEAISENISGSIPFSENIHRDDMPAFVKIMRDTAVGVPYSETEFRIRNASGRYLWCRIRATTQFSSDGRPVKAVGVIADIDQEQKQKQALIAQAQYDTLTGIYNKSTINALVEQRMEAGGLIGCQALLIIDVDHFKAVNDTYGHLCGDSVLSDVASALRDSIRSSDLAGRIGGDEFLVYLPEVADEEAVRQKAECILASVSRIRPEAGAQPVSCSIGAVVLPHGTADYQTLYRHADRALYQQKNGGRGGATLVGMEEGADSLSCELPVTAVGSTIVSDEGKVVDEWLPQYAFRALYEAKDTAAAIDRLLEIAGHAFDVSRAYIFENAPDGTSCSNTFEWCGEGVAAQIQSLQQVSYVNELAGYEKNFDEKGVFYCARIEDLNPRVCALLEPQGIRSMLQCAMLDEGRFVGYVGFDECRENRAWSEAQVAAFKLTADVLSTFLIKLRLKQKALPQSLA